MLRGALAAQTTPQIQSCMEKAKFIPTPLLWSKSGNYTMTKNELNIFTDDDFELL